ncbi:MAG: hypothetical protein ACYSSO_09235, partial [Planctomycetota bacterium]
MTKAFTNKHSETLVAVSACSKFCLRRCLTFTFAIYALLFAFINIAVGQSDAAADLSDPKVRREAVERLARQSRQRKMAAWSMAQSQGWVPRQTINNTTFELMAIDGDKVYAYKTCNKNAAISIAVNLIRNIPPYDVNGADLTAGVWDAGAVRPTHQEFGSRVTVKETMGNHDHSTHVGGTIAASGVQANALGMAPSILIDSYEWNNDVS